MLRSSRPETNEEVFEIAGSEKDVAELVKRVARTLSNSVEWETNVQPNAPDTHMGRWRCDPKPIGRVDENMMACLNRDALVALGLCTKEPENGPDTVNRKEQI